MRGLEKNRMGRGHINIYIHRHRDLLTNSAQRAELVKNPKKKLEKVVELVGGGSVINGAYPV